MDLSQLKRRCDALHEMELTFCHATRALYRMRDTRENESYLFFILHPEISTEITQLSEAAIKACKAWQIEFDRVVELEAKRNGKMKHKTGDE